MLIGNSAKTNNFKFIFFWPSLGENRDFAFASQVGTWVGQNAKVLDKRRPSEALSLLAEQFQDLQELDAISFNGPLARMRK
jgi:hypothetical protein